MARLPVYVDQGTISDGSGTFRTTRESDAIGAGLSNIGSTLGKISANIEAGDERIRAKMESERVKAEGLADELDYQKFYQKVQTDFDGLKSSITETGQDFTTGTIKHYDQLAAAHLAALPPHRQAEMEVRYAKLRSQITNEASKFEYDTRMKTLGKVADEIHDSAASTVSLNPKLFGTQLEEVKQRAASLGLQGTNAEMFVGRARVKMERAVLAAAAERDPEGVMRSAQGAFKDLPTREAPENVKTIAEGATKAGLDPKWALAITNFESGNKSDTVPRRKDGVLLSTAKGEWQVLDGTARDLGIKDKSNLADVSVRVSGYLASKQEQMRKSGIEPTLGKTYAYWNLGEGVAKRLVSADPSTSFDNLLYSVYGDSSYQDKSTGTVRLWREAVVENNPALYKHGMTVGEVLNRLEQRMAGSLTKVSGDVGQGAFPTEAAARAAYKQATGLDAEYITPVDMANAVNSSIKTLQKVSKEGAKLVLGSELNKTPGAMRANDPEHQAALDFFYRQGTTIGDGLLKGDPASLTAARDTVRTTNYIPKPVIESARQLIMSGDSRSPASAAAFQMLSDIYTDNPTAWDAAKVPEDLEKRVKSYTTKTRNGEQPVDAIKFINDLHSPEGEKRRQAIRQELEGKKGEVEKLKYNDFASALAEGFRNPTPTDQNGTGSSVAESEFVHTGRDLYRDYRLQGYSPEDARLHAVEDLKRVYGVSNAFVGITERGRLMRDPPDARYRMPTTGMAPFEAQAKELVQADLSRRYPPKEVQQVVSDNMGNFGVTRRLREKLARDEANLGSQHSAANVDIRVVATGDTRSDFLRKVEAPRYQIWYRDPKSGQPVLAYSPNGSATWQPNIDRMRNEDREAFLAKSAKADEAKKTQIADPKNDPASIAESLNYGRYRDDRLR